MNKMLIKISVVVPVLNNSVGLTKCLDSIFNQHVNGLEVIVIDGGSTDGTIEVINQYSAQISYWESGKDSGITDAFNRGIRISKGDLIVILNSDDFWEKGTLKNVINVAAMNPHFDIYYGDLRFHNLKTGEQYVLNSSLDGIQRRMTIFHPSIFVRKKAYEKIGLFDNNYQYAMDSEWIHRALKSNLSFFKIPLVLANMSLGGKSDINFKKSLAEYRKSLISHQIQTPLLAWIYYLIFSTGKSLMQFNLMNRFYRKFINRVAT